MVKSFLSRKRRQNSNLWNIMGKPNWLFLHGYAGRNLKLMFQFCLKISCLPFLTVYSMHLTLLANEPRLAFLFGLVTCPHESFLIILLPLEHLQPARSKGSPRESPLRDEIPAAPLKSCWIPSQGQLDELMAAEKPVATFPSVGRSKVLPFLPASCTPLCSAIVVLMLFLYKVLIIAIPLPFISTEQKLPSSNLETCLWEFFLD